MRIGGKEDEQKPTEAAPVVPQPIDQGAPMSKEFDWTRVRSKDKRRKEEKKAAKEREKEEEAEAEPVGPTGRKPIKQSHAIAAAVGGVVLAIIAMWFVLSPSGELAPTYTVEQMDQLKKEEKRADRAILNKMEKDYGPDHPQVRQMKMELGDIPFSK